jgi:quercetin dioxygenase-like cupin family protein
VSAYAHLSSLARLVIWDGVIGRAVQGERATLVVVELAPGAVVPEHRHDNEQLGVCAVGSLTFQIGGETRELGPGDTWEIRSDVPHSAEAGPEGAVLVETFVPVRGDWDEFERLDPEAPRWPSVT